MTAAPYDWTRFERRIFIAADVTTVFRAWAVPENIVNWFIAKAEYQAADGTIRPHDQLVQPGDEYHWEWHQEQHSSGSVVEVVEDQNLSFTFGQKGPGSQEMIIVTVDVSAMDDGMTLLRLV